jgi:hypothetical protein
MKFPLPSLFRSGLLLGVLAVSVAAAEPEQSDTTAQVKFSDPGKPGTLKVLLPWADVQVTGTDAAEITVTANLAEKGKGETRSDGLRRLDQEQSFELTEKDNVAVLRMAGDEAWGPQGSEFKIQLPRRTALMLRTELGGDVRIENVDGDIEVSSMNGEVTLKDIGSSAVVNTMNGEINASFKTAPQKPVSLSSMNGEINLSLPGDTKANLRMRSHNGSLLTDFPEGVLKTKSERLTGHGAHAGLSREEVQVLREAAREAARAGQEAARHIQEAAVAPTATPAPAAVPDAAEAPVAIPAIPAIPAMPAGFFGGKSISGTLNGGGVDITLATMNGTITVRQAK